MAREQDILEQSLRAKDREIRGLEEKLRAQDATLQNINRILEHQDRAMAALTNLQHLYATAASMREVAGPFIELAVKAARCEGGLLALRDTPQGTISVVSAIGDRAELVRGQIYGEAEGIVGEVARSGMPLLVPDARREPRLRGDGPEHVIRESRNALCVPIVGGSGPWGALLLVNTLDRKRFSKGDVDLLTIFALRLARELERESESSRTRDEAVRLSTLLRVTELLHVAADRQKMADLLVQLAARLVKAGGSAVYLLDETQQTLSCVASSERLAAPVQFAVGTGVAGWVALEGKAVNSATEADRWVAGQSSPVFSFPIHSVVAVPIRGARRLLGVLEVVNRSQQGGFDQSDVNLLSVLGREAGLALDHKQQTLEDQRTIMELLRGMARFLDAKSPHLLGHSERVAKVSQTLAEEMGLSPEETHQAYMSGLLHDLGNVGVDDELFMAPRKLTDAEVQQMRGHTSIGAEILREVGALRHLMAGPLYHHERYDGGGYPQGLVGEGIPLLARVVAVAEAFDAVRSARPYRAAMSLPEALAHVRSGEGSAFDPRVVNALLTAYQRGKLPA